jgi:hypothetical protein
MKCVGHIERMGEMRNAKTISISNPEGGDHFENLGIDGRII